MKKILIPKTINELHQVLYEEDYRGLDIRFPKEKFSEIQSIINSDGDLPFLLARVLEKELQLNGASHITNNIAYWLGKNNEYDFSTEVQNSYKLSIQYDKFLKFEFLRSHMITLGNLISDSFIFDYIRNLSVTDNNLVNLCYYLNYYGGYEKAFKAIKVRLKNATFPNSVLDLNTVYYNLSGFSHLFDSEFLDTISDYKGVSDRKEKFISTKILDYKSSCFNRSRFPDVRIFNKTFNYEDLYMYDVFISHASEDKEDVVCPLIIELEKLGAQIWYDEFEIKPGDKIREKIDEGLSKSKFGIIVFSPIFFQKSWTRAELDALFTLEIFGKSKVIPLLHDMKVDELLTHSPLVASKLCLLTKNGIDEVAKKIIEII